MRCQEEPVRDVEDEVGTQARCDDPAASNEHRRRRNEEEEERRKLERPQERCGNVDEGVERPGPEMLERLNEAPVLLFRHATMAEIERVERIPVENGVLRVPEPAHRKGDSGRDRQHPNGSASIVRRDRGERHERADADDRRDARVLPAQREPGEE